MVLVRGPQTSLDESLHRNLCHRNECITVYAFATILLQIYEIATTRLQSMQVESSGVTDSVGASDRSYCFFYSSARGGAGQTLCSERSEVQRAERAKASEASRSLRMRAVVYLKLGTAQTKNHT